MEQSRERINTPTLYLGVVGYEEGAFGSPLNMVANFNFTEMAFVATMIDMP